MAIELAVKNLSLIEAAKSGKDFGLESENSWYFIDDDEIIHERGVFKAPNPNDEWDSIEIENPVAQLTLTQMFSTNWRIKQ